MQYVTKKNLFIVFAAILAVLFTVNWHLGKEVDQLSTRKVKDQLAMILRSELNAQKENALRYALMISYNDALTEAIHNDDEDGGYLILSGLMHAIEEYTNAVIRAQIITDDYLIFARSWDNAFAGMPIDEYRPDLQYFLENKKPRSAIEIGRRLGIKATVPITKDGELLGFVEVLQFFEGITEYFRRMGVELYILMDERYYSLALLMQNNPFVANNRYIVANRYYSKAYLNDLDAVDFDRLLQREVEYYNRKYFFYEPMTNGAGESIGAFVMIVPEKRVKRFASNEDDLSFLLNFTRTELYEIASERESIEEVGYKSRYDKELLYLKDVVDKEDRELFYDEAREMLREYSKEELIGLILNYNASREIKGEIR